MSSGCHNKGHLSLFSWSLGIYSCSVTYHLTSAPFPPSSGVDHTLFQSPINQRTKPFISHQSHGVPNNNHCSAQQLRVCTVALLLGKLSYVKFTYFEDTSLQWYCYCNIFNIRLSYMTAILSATCPCGGDTTI